MHDRHDGMERTLAREKGRKRNKNQKQIKGNYSVICVPTKRFKWQAHKYQDHQNKVLHKRERAKWVASNIRFC